MEPITILIYFLVVRGPDMQPDIKQDLAAQVEMLNPWIKSTGYRFETKRVRTIPSPVRARSLSNIESRNQVYAKLRLYGIRRGYIRKQKWITSFVVPGPLDVPTGKRWSYGFASRICATKRFPMTLTTNVSWLRLRGLVALWHELCHILGARHDTVLPATLMHPNALAYIAAGPLTPSAKSTFEMLMCRVGTYFEEGR